MIYTPIVQAVTMPNRNPRHSVRSPRATSPDGAMVALLKLWIPEWR